MAFVLYRWVRHLLLAVACFGTVTCSKVEPPVTSGAPLLSPKTAATIPVDAPKVAFLGDSLAAGLHLPLHQAFPAQLADILHSLGHPIHVTNAGVSGDTTAGGQRRVAWLLEQKPDILVIELGGNDGLRGVSAAAIQKNLESIVDQAKKAGVFVLLLGVQLPANYGAEYVESVSRVYAEVATTAGISFVSNFMVGVAGVAELNLADGLHPNAAGHHQLALNVVDALVPLVESVVNHRRDTQRVK